ncbi:DUF4386 family protein [Alteromonas sp. H39]|uniref:DUF4386 family protein n=1 Tax=Alteromonas sp. H39 TaxID=3389876 RepID=UPI0039E176F1
MTIQQWGGAASILQGLTYIFGFILFFGILDTGGHDTPEQFLEFVIFHRDTYFLGYVVIGGVFSFALMILVQALYARFRHEAPELMKFAAVVGYMWAFIVMSSSLIFLTSLNPLATYFEQDPQQALIISRTITIIVDALGGGIELIGAVWLLAVSTVGIKSRIFGRPIHYWGIVVGISGVLTLFSGLSFLATNPFFEVTTAMFGLGQIVWFLCLGVLMIKAPGHDKMSGSAGLA